MKLIMLFIFSGLITPILCQTSKAWGDPHEVTGKDIKLGRKPPGVILAKGKTDAQGVFEFKNMEAGTGYYLEYDLKENGIKSAASTFKIDGIDLTFVNTNTKNKSTPKVFTKVHGDYEITITITEVATTERGRGTPISTSRSNIKGQIVKKTIKPK